MNNKDNHTIINPLIPLTPWGGYVVCGGVSKSKTAPAPV